MREMNRDKSNLIQALKHYNACILLSIITAQALFSFGVAVDSDASGLLQILGAVVIALHLFGVFCFTRAIKFMEVWNAWLIVLYMFVPLGNLYCIIELSKRINQHLEALGIDRVIIFADIKAIEKTIEELGK